MLFILAGYFYLFFDHVSLSNIKPKLTKILGESIQYTVMVQCLNKCYLFIYSVYAVSEFNFAQYEIISGNEENNFACDIETGRIYTTQYLVFDEQSVSAIIYFLNLASVRKS